MDGIVENLIQFLDQYLSRELVVFVISLMPILELRGGLLAAYLLQIPWQTAFLICFLANIIPVPFILIFGRKIINWMKSTKLFHKLGHKFEERAKKKSQSKFMQKYKMLGLFLFVAVPLPGTGAWTGSLVAAIMDMRLKHALPMVAGGVLGAGFIMTLLSYGLLQSIGIG